MARKRDPEHSGHPLFWLLLGFLCGVMATLGVFLLGSKDAGDDEQLVVPSDISVPIEPPVLKGAPPPGGVLVPPPSVEPATPIQEPIARPVLPTFRPEPQAAPVNSAPRPAPGRSNADQMAEDAAASGMTSRTR